MRVGGAAGNQRIATGRGVAHPYLEVVQRDKAVQRITAQAYLDCNGTAAGPQRKRQVSKNMEMAVLGERTRCRTTVADGCCEATLGKQLPQPWSPPARDKGTAQAGRLTRRHYALLAQVHCKVGPVLGLG